MRRDPARGQGPPGPEGGAGQDPMTLSVDDLLGHLARVERQVGRLAEESGTQAVAGAPSARPPPRLVVAESGAAPLPLSSGTSTERAGQPWMAWVGAIVMVLGAGFLVKLGSDAGLWGDVPGSARCLIAAGLGGLLLLAGELALRWIGVAASAVLFCAGLGTLYLDAYAANAWVEPAVVGRQAAFLLMALVTFMGMGLSVHGGFPAVGIMCTIGGYIAPLLLWGEPQHTVTIGLYLTLLLGTALWLSATRAGTFRPLRYVALCGHGSIGMGWILTATTTWAGSLMIAALWWGFVVAESLAAAIRRQSARGNVAVCGAATAWFATVGCWVLAGTEPWGRLFPGPFVASMGLVAALVAAHFGPAPAELGRRPLTALAAFSIGLWAQFGLLLAAAIAVQMSAWGQALGWMALGLVAIEVGRRLRSGAVETFGLAVGLLGALQVALLDAWPLPGRYDEPLLVLGPAELSRHGLLGLAVVVAALAAARRLGDSRRVLPVATTGAAVLAWMATCEHQAAGLAVTAGWLAAAAILMAAEALGRRQQYFFVGLVALGATALRFLIADALLPRILRDPGHADAGVPMANATAALGITIGLTGIWGARRLARQPGGVGRLPLSWQAAASAIVVFGLVVLSFEVTRAIDTLETAGVAFSLAMPQVEQLLLTLLWAGGSVVTAMIAAAAAAPPQPGGPGHPAAILPRLAWVILVVCAGKWITHDTLHWTVLEGAGRPVHVPVLWNLQMFAGVAVAGAGLAVARLCPASLRLGGLGARRPSALIHAAKAMPVAAAVLALWGLSFEVDRALYRLDAAATWPWSPFHARALCWTALWGTGGLGMMLWSARSGHGAMMTSGWLLLAGTTIAWLGPDTLAWRPQGAAATACVLNLQFGVGAALATTLGVGAWTYRRHWLPQRLMPRGPVDTVAIGLAALVVLWLGSLELDRFVELRVQAGHLLRDAAGMARQTAFSIYWASCASAALVLGFAKRLRPFGAAGAGLLALTAAKVLAVDMSPLHYAWRLAALCVVATCIVAAGVVSSRLAQRLPDGRAGDAPLLRAV